MSAALCCSGRLARQSPAPKSASKGRVCIVTLTAEEASQARCEAAGDVGTSSRPSGNADGAAPPAPEKPEGL